MNTEFNKELLAFSIGSLLLPFLLNYALSQNNHNSLVGIYLSNVGKESTCKSLLKGNCDSPLVDMNTIQSSEEDSVNPMNPLDFTNYSNPSSPYFGGNNGSPF